jgi:hypothetical protein
MQGLRTIAIMMSLLVPAACSDESASDSGYDASASTSSEVESDSSELGTANFLGFVANAFEVTVDGTVYQDLEDFYTQEMDRLPEKVQAAGYDPSYKIDLEAEIGFSDLWNGMQVYLLSTGKQGYQGQAAVGSNGAFTVTLPDAALNDTFKVRANKRIRVVISNGSEQQNLCYNFSAREKSVQLTENSKPIILDSFDTSLTKYDCPASEVGSGLEVPSSTVQKLKPGLSKAQVLGILGSVGLTLDSSSKWCWDAFQVKTVCSTHYVGPCSCSVSYDEKGKLQSIDNIKSTWLDILAW